jgi:uncharacterized protein YukE
MADLIKVDTERVSAAAKQIAQYNRKIRDDFSAVELAMKALANVWDGTASSQAISAFHELKQAYDEPRYEVMNNFVTFLHQQVDPGYTQTETTNVSLADRFK